MPRWIKCMIIFGGAWFCLVKATLGAAETSILMKGPAQNRPTRAYDQTVESSCMKLVFKAAIGFYKSTIAPTGGIDRCGFRPSCSTYAYEVVCEQDPWIALIMIGDRLTRCNVWKKPGPDYTLLPNGKLYDPPSKNVIRQPR